MSARALVVCPGRGSYGAAELGYLARRRGSRQAAGVVDAVIHTVDAWRRHVGSEPVEELDARERFSAARHLTGENAGPLIFTASVADFAMLERLGIEPVVVCGNSMGWYTALAVSGALELDQAARLVDTMSKSQRHGLVGGQLILPWVDAEWRPDPGKREAIEAVLREVARTVGPCAVSIELGGFLVLAGDDKAVVALLDRLPHERVGRREYPFQLAQHAAFHTPLMAEASRLGRRELSRLDWRPPRTPLVDGRGAEHRAGTATGRAIFDYTLTTQVLETYDFTTSLRVALREYAPDHVILLGPGDSLGGAIGQTLVMEGWQGLRNKSDFAARQAGDDPVLTSVGRPEQLDRLIAGRA